MTGLLDEEVTLTTDNGTEITVRKGVVFKEGTIAVQVYDHHGDGASAYLSLQEARTVRDVLTTLLDERTSS